MAGIITKYYSTSLNRYIGPRLDAYIVSCSQPANQTSNFNLQPPNLQLQSLVSNTNSTMATITTTELVNEGHNILDRGIGVAYDSHSGDTKAIYRSREGLNPAGGGVAFLASAGLGCPGGWTDPL